MSSGRDEMMEKWNEESWMKKMVSVAHELDEYFMTITNKYELSVSALNGILMARLLRLNVEVGNEENLYKLLQVVMQKEIETYDRSIH